MKSLLIIEDDSTYAAGLVRSLSRRGFSCMIANNRLTALEICKKSSPTHILLDLNLGEERGEEIISPIKTLLPKSHLVVLTGYGTIPSAVRSMREGATSYLCKPTTPEAIEKALSEKPLPSGGELWRMEKQHIQQVLSQCGGNISRAAKTLGLHRRTLQRKLKKI